MKNTYHFQVSEYILFYDLSVLMAFFPCLSLDVIHINVLGRLPLQICSAAGAN